MPDSSHALGGPKLSGRGIQQVNTLKEPSPFAFVGSFYHKEKNPDGIIRMATAENSLLNDELLDASSVSCSPAWFLTMTQYFHSHFRLTSSHLKYRTSLVGGYEQSTKTALPEYFNAYFNPRIKILPQHCVHADGIGSLLAQVIWALCEPGDGVLMTTPYYDTYPRDIHYPAQAKVIPAHVPTTIDPLSLAATKHVRSALENKENCVRVIILCNPHNPLATPHCQEVIVEYARIAEEASQSIYESSGLYNVHLLVDEIYGLQVFSSKYVPNPTPFVSILSLDVQSLANCNPARIHVLGGPTKDFGSSGLKVGSLISQHNPDLLRIVERAVQAAPMSSASDALFTSVLNDTTFRDWFLRENRVRLREAFELAGDWCTFHKLPFTPASAGVFFIIDFAPALGRVSEAALDPREQTIAGFKAMQNAGVYLVPTFDSEDPIVTRFRMTFTLPREKATYISVGHT